MAGFAIRSRFAGHARRSAKARHALRVKPDHPMGAGQTAGTLSADAFAINSSGNATASSHRIIYEADTGELYFDKDGSGSAAKVRFATLGTNLSLTNADFLVY